VWAIEYCSRRISLSDRGLKWAFATLGLTYLDCYLPKWDIWLHQWYIHQKRSEGDRTSCPPARRSTWWTIIWTSRQNLCASKKGWRCLLTTVPFDIDRHVCIESSPWLSRTTYDSLYLVTTLLCKCMYVMSSRELDIQSRLLLEVYSGADPSHTLLTYIRLHNIRIPFWLMTLLGQSSPRTYIVLPPPQAGPLFTSRNIFDFAPLACFV